MTIRFGFKEQLFSYRCCRYVLLFVMFAGELFSSTQIETFTMEHDGADHKVKEGRLLHKIGSQMLSQGNLSGSIDHFYKALVLFKEAHNDTLIAATYRSLAKLNSFLGKYKDALHFNRLAYQYYLEIGNDESLAAIMSEIGNCYLEVNNDALALYYLKKSEKLLENLSKPDLTALCEIRLSIYQYKKNNFDLALQYLHSARQKSNTGNGYKNMWTIYNNLGYIYFKLGKQDSAITYLKRAQTIAEQFNNLRGKAVVNESLFEYYYSRNDYKNALKSYLLFNRITDSISKKDVKEKLLVAETESRFRQKEQLMKVEKKIKESEYDKRLQSQSYFYVVVIFIITSCLLIVLFILSYRNFNLKVKANRQLAQLQKEKLELITDIQENERAIIAREIHDSVGAQIISIKILTSNCIKYVSDDYIKNRLEKVVLQSDRLATHLRNISHRMLPTTLLELGLVAGIDELLGTLLVPAGINYHFQHQLSSTKLSQNVHLGIYRMLEELLVNVIKHSSAKNVNLTIYQNSMYLIIMMEDDGVGLFPQQGKGIGLKNINARARALDGTFRTESSQEGGAHSVIRINLGHL